VHSRSSQVVAHTRRLSSWPALPPRAFLPFLPGLGPLLSPTHWAALLATLLLLPLLFVDLKRLSRLSIVGLCSSGLVVLLVLALLGLDPQRKGMLQQVCHQLGLDSRAGWQQAAPELLVKTAPARFKSGWAGAPLLAPYNHSAPPCNAVHAMVPCSHLRPAT
jgi:predicted PurR-regulated permease PerM